MITITGIVRFLETTKPTAGKAVQAMPVGEGGLISLAWLPQGI